VEAKDGAWTTWKVVGFPIKLIVVIAALAYLVEFVTEILEKKISGERETTWKITY